MGDAGFFRGTSTEQDNRFSDKHKKDMKKMKFSKTFEHKVDMHKVDLAALKPWITEKITQMLGGIEDDVLLEFILCQLEQQQYPDPRVMQLNLTGFLSPENARKFMHQLWTLLLNAANRSKAKQDT